MSELIKELKKTAHCPICKNSSFNNLGKIKNQNKTMCSISDLLYHMHDERYIGKLHKDLDNIFELIQCSFCGHSCLSLMPDQELLDRMYRSNSPYLFEESEVDMLSKKNFKEKKMDGVIPNFSHWIYKYLENSKPAKYFEVGPGNCILFKTFKDKGWFCEGYDLQGWITGKGIYNFFEKIPKNQKDVMVIQDVLEHVANPINFLKQFSFFLKKSGYIFLTFPNASSYRAKIFKSRWRMVAPLSHVNYFTKKSIKMLLEDCGFQPIIVKPVSMVVLKKLIRSIIRLPIVIILDLLN